MQAGYLYEWVSIKHKSITRDIDFGSEIISRHIEVTIRWRAGVTTDMRVYHRDGRIFEIIDAVEIPRRRGLVMTCQEYSV